jgi:hypothetical protein
MYLGILRQARWIISNHLGRQLSGDVSLAINDVAQQEPGIEGQALAYTKVAMNDLGQWTCLVFVEPSLRGVDTAIVQATLAHEMFHCFQYDIAPGHRTAGIPKWIVEGQAEWVGEAAFNSTPVGNSWWTAYLIEPRRHLWWRSYDAVGFYEHLAEVGIDPWKKLDAMLLAGGSVAAFKAADATQDSFLDSWASGLYRDKQLPAGWYANGRWSSLSRGDPVELRIHNGTLEEVEADAVSNWDYHVVATAEVTEIAVNGHARATTLGQDFIGVADHFFCTMVGGCVCPTGTTFDGPPLTDAGGEIALALTGSLDGASGTVRGRPLSDFCKPEASAAGNGPKGGANPCARGCAMSVGEPHLTAIDGTAFDFQAAGEYVLLRSADGAFEVQARQQPFRDARDVSIDTALAFRVNGHRVSIYAKPAGSGGALFSVRVDGVESPPFATTDLGNGAQLAPMAFGIEVAWPDGTLAWAFPSGGEGYGLDLTVAPSDGAKLGMTGLLAGIPEGSELPRLADGTVLPLSGDHGTRYNQLFGQVAPSWHVTDAASLFDYAAGETTASFDIAGFPDPDLPMDMNEVQLKAGVDAVAAAGETCAAIESREREFLHCMFDVLATQDPAWAAFYQQVLKLLDQGPAALQGPPVSPSGMSIVDDISDASGQLLLEDGTVVAAVGHREITTELVAIDPTSGQILRRTPTTGSVSIGLAARSLWVGTSEETCGLDRLDPSTFAQQGSITAPCSVIGPTFVATGDRVWVVDGSSLRRVDPATNGFAETIALPIDGGRFMATNGTIYYGTYDIPGHWYRLTPTDSAFVDMGDLPGYTDAFAGGGALWTQDIDGLRSYTAPGAPTASVAVDFEGTAVGADQSAVYVAKSDVSTAHSELWRYPIDGSAPSMVASNDVSVPGALGNFRLDYADGSLLFGDVRLAATWLLAVGIDQPGRMYVQLVQLP